MKTFDLSSQRVKLPTSDVLMVETMSLNFKDRADLQPFNEKSSAFAAEFLSLHSKENQKKKNTTHLKCSVFYYS